MTILNGLHAAEEAPAQRQVAAGCDFAHSPCLYLEVHLGHSEALQPRLVHLNIPAPQGRAGAGRSVGGRRRCCQPSRRLPASQLCCRCTAAHVTLHRCMWCQHPSAFNVCVCSPPLPPNVVHPAHALLSARPVLEQVDATCLLRLLALRPHLRQGQEEPDVAPLPSLAPCRCLRHHCHLALLPAARTLAAASQLIRTHKPSR